MRVVWDSVEELSGSPFSLDIPIAVPLTQQGRPSQRSDLGAQYTARTFPCERFDGTVACPNASLGAKLLEFPEAPKDRITVHLVRRQCSEERFQRRRLKHVPRVGRNEGNLLKFVNWVFHNAKREEDKTGPNDATQCRCMCDGATDNRRWFRNCIASNKAKDL